MKFRLALATLMLVALPRFSIGISNMSLLTMLEFNRNTNSTLWPACDAAVQFVINHVNSRSDILPQYRLVLHHEDQGANALLSNYAIMNYLRSHGDTYISPVVFGPTKSCQTSGLTLRNLDLTTFSPQCAGPFIVERKNLYSTLYSAMAPANLQAWSMLSFITHVGQWKEIGIVTNRNNPNEYKRAEFLADIAVKHDVNVLFYSNELPFTMETMENLKKSNARIIGVVINQRPLCLQFLCLAHKAGIRAPFYVFIFATYNCMITDIDSQILPDGCTKAMIAEQTTAMISAGTYGGWTGTDDFQNSLGYNYNYFKQEFEKLVSDRLLPDSGTELVCHDTAMAIVITLDRSEQILKRDFNLTLQAWNDYPNIVGKVVNETASKVEFQGLRIHDFKYNSNGQLDEDMWIGQSMKGKGLRLLYRMKYIGTKNLSLSERNLTDFQIEQRNEIIWYTKTGKKPKDLSQIEIKSQPCSIAFPIAIGILVAFSFLSFTFFTVTQQQRQPDNAFASNMTSTVALKSGCFVLTISSMVHSIGAISFPNFECQIRFLGSFLGLACLFPTLAANLSAYVNIGILYNLKHLDTAVERKVSRNTKQSIDKQIQSSARVMNKQRFRSKIVHEMDEAKVQRQWNRRITLGITTLVPSLITAIAIWTALFPLSLKFDFTKPLYDSEVDVYYRHKIGFCQNYQQLTWLLIFILIFTILLFGSAISAFQIKKTGVDKKYQCFVTRLNIATMNAGTFFYFCCFLVLLLNNSGQCILINCIAFTEVSIAISTQLTLMAPQFDK